MGDGQLHVRLSQTGPISLDVEFTCRRHEVLAIFGPSGAGKTTVLRTIAGLYSPQSAVVESGAQTWTNTGNGVFVPTHRRRVGFVFQDYALFPHLTAAGNVVTALEHHPRETRRARAETLLNLVRLGHVMARRPHELSGGEQQRVALARALAREPAVLLLDEPFAAVDRAVRRQLQDDLDELRRTLDIPVVLVTHDFDDVVRLATHAVILERGRSIAAGAIAELSVRPDLNWLKDAVGLGSVLNATVSRMLPERGLMELAFPGGTLLVASRSIATGAAVRVRIPAREVILANRNPEGLSLHNVLKGTVAAVHREAGGDVVVQVAVGPSRVLAEVTEDGLSRLSIAPGNLVHALIKSVSVQVVGAPLQS